MMWAGRAIREKGIKELVPIVRKVKKPLYIFPLLREETPGWMRKIIDGTSRPIKMLHVKESLNRKELAAEFQKSKLFLFPIQWEEPFGLVLIESLASGTPVVAYARGSVTEVIEDGVTGFIVNPIPSNDNKNFIIKKTGIEGLCEAIERIYNLPESEYREMRLACRRRAEKHFTVQRMAKRYIETYKKVIADWKTNK